ncbi:MAG TPA: helix-turn-helix domain-containing protein [Solirubrobacteraceae bacterium]|jgi:AcrR family transcriptional regulator|nr:helix-turn-helix domain-containing protein [Solirubrobacteraceae bacterium]
MSSSQEDDRRSAGSDSAAEPIGTKLLIVEAALRTLKTNGFAGASARAIAHEGGFNQALIFYHFGSVRNLLLAVLDLISQRRMNEYGPAVERAHGPRELATIARTIYADDLERGYITVLGEMVSGGVADAELGAEVAARIEPWIGLLERKLEHLLKRSPALLLASPGDLAFGLVAIYFGVDMLSHLQADQSRAESLLDLGTRLAGLAEPFLSRQLEGPL